MFDVGFSELVLISIIGLLVLGPERLPKVAAEIGKWVGRARRTATQLRRQLEREIEIEELERLRTSSTAPPSSQPNTPAPTGTGDSAAPANPGSASVDAPPASLDMAAEAPPEGATTPADGVAESSPAAAPDKPPHSG